MRGLTALFLVCFAGPNLHGQYVDLREGGRIRIQTSAHPKWLYGQFVALDSSGLRLTKCEACEIQLVELPQLRHFEASTGRTGRSFALEGAIVGAVAGAVLGRYSARKNPNGSPGDIFSCREGCAANAAEAEGALVGCVLGTTVGAFFRREHWESIHLTRTQERNR